MVVAEFSQIFGNCPCAEFGTQRRRLGAKNSGSIAGNKKALLRRSPVLVAGNTPGKRVLVPIVRTSSRQSQLDIRNDTMMKEQGLRALHPEGFASRFKNDRFQFVRTLGPQAADTRDVAAGTVPDFPQHARAIQQCPQFRQRTGQISERSPIIVKTGRIEQRPYRDPKTHVLQRRQVKERAASCEDGS